MMLIKISFIVASLAGCLGVVLGAFGAHALRGTVEARLLETFQTGVQYQMIHALALMMVAVLMQQWGRSTALDIAAWGFIAGMVLFSGSLYGLVLTDLKWLGPVTPIGGVCFILAWLALAAGGYQHLG